MKALTVRQPWASLIIAGIKRHETRTWATHHRGPLVIHAGQAWNSTSPFPHRHPMITVPNDWIEELTGQSSGALAHRESDLAVPRGVILGTVALVDVFETTDYQPTSIERQLGDYGPGHYAWVLTTPRPLSEPIPATGRQGIWDWTPEAHPLFDAVEQADDRVRDMAEYRDYVERIDPSRREEFDRLSPKEQLDAFFAHQRIWGEPSFAVSYETQAEAEAAITEWRDRLAEIGIIFPPNLDRRSHK